MEYYLHSCSGYAVNILYEAYLTAEITSMKASIFADILTKCASHFSGWLLFHINSVGARGRKQMFYITFVNHYFGLSRDGIELNSSIGYGVTLGMYDRERKRHEELSKDATLAVIQKGEYLQWWDNFSKFQARQVPTIKKDIFASCLWTGVTVNEYTGPPVDVSVRTDATGAIIPAMPDDLFAHQALMLKGFDDVYLEGREFFSRSMVKKYDIVNVPLKVDTKRFPNLAATMNSVKNTTKHINPYKLIKHNIGSNLGLVTILREYQDDNKMNLHGTVHKYSTINTDENIFYRGMKVFIFMSYFFCCICHSRMFFQVLMKGHFKNRCRLTLCLVMFFENIPSRRKSALVFKKTFLTHLFFDSLFSLVISSYYCTFILRPFFCVFIISI